MSELSNKEIKITMISILRTLKEKNRMQKQMVNLHRKSETYRKNQKKMLIRITVNKMLFMDFFQWI